MNAAQFKSRAERLLRDNVPSIDRLEWVWTYRGRAKGDPRREVRTGYAVVHAAGGAAVHLYHADWMTGYPVEVKRVHDMSWHLLSLQDQSVIKGGRGNVPSPADYGVPVFNSSGKRVA